MDLKGLPLWSFGTSGFPTDSSQPFLEELLEMTMCVYYCPNQINARSVLAAVLGTNVSRSLRAAG